MGKLSFFGHFFWVDPHKNRRKAQEEALIRCLFCFIYSKHGLFLQYFNFVQVLGFQIVDNLNKGKRLVIEARRGVSLSQKRLPRIFLSAAKRHRFFGGETLLSLVPEQRDLAACSRWPAFLFEDEKDFGGLNLYDETD
ncbi:MAG: hypothetical protein HFJ85_06310 [Oscillospiraceae bacterium]|nr:hypothetical protein [Oscillospiraceae bacterium]